MINESRGLNINRAALTVLIFGMGVFLLMAGCVSGTPQQDEKEHVRELQHLLSQKEKRITHLEDQLRDAKILPDKPSYPNLAVDTNLARVSLKTTTESAHNKSTPETKPQLVKRYSRTTVNIRQGRGTGFNVAGRLKRGEKVQIGDIQNGWAAIYENDRRQGYVYIALLDKNPPKKISKEKKLLRNTYWGDFRKARKNSLKDPQKKTLTIWNPILQYARTTLYPKLGSWAKSADDYIEKMHGLEKLDIRYDELWIWERDEGFTESEKRKYRGRLDIFKLYWWKGQVQAQAVEKFYVGNPVTDRRLSTPTYRIVSIADRRSIFEELQKS